MAPATNTCSADSCHQAAIVKRLCLSALLVLGLSWLPAPVQAAPQEDQDWPLSSRILDSFSAGNFARVIDDAPRALAAEPHNDELRLAYANSLLWHDQAWQSSEQFHRLLGTALEAQARLGLANSLAWTGRVSESIQHYEKLLTTPLDKPARLGLANALRWSGRADQALPHYRRLLSDDPGSTDAARGIVYCERVLRPSTVVGFERLHDSSPMTRGELQIRHTFRDDSRTRIFSLIRSADRDKSSTMSSTQDAAALEVEDLGLPMAPRLSIGRAYFPAELTLWDLRLKLSEAPTYLYVGKENWGKTAFNIPALQAALTANRLGFSATLLSAAGALSASINTRHISDGNRVSDADLKLTPRWRPFDRAIQIYTGLAGRRATRVAADYWSPLHYSVGYVGIKGEWEGHDWSLAGFASIGGRLAGEASNYWSTGISAKRWLTDDWALALRLSAQSSAGAGSYKSNGLSVQLEKLWR
jgi:tetratricopeptide (TPR) repeat protein